jgi:hypothetical protein
VNERIKELARQAGMRECSLGYGMPENVLWGEQQIQEFAELIVKDVLEYLEFERSMYANPGTYQSREYYERMDAKENALSDAIGDIKSKYGVKE